MTKILAILVVVFSTQMAIASGPMDRTTWRPAYANGYTDYTDVEACEKAMKRAKRWAEKLTSKDREFDKEGFTVDTVECSNVTRKSDCECKPTKNYERTCNYKGEFLCTEWVYHKDQ